MKIRNITENDIPQMMELIKNCEHLHFERAGIYWFFWKFFRDTCFVAVENEKIIGLLMGIISQSDPKEAYIYNLGVLLDHRRKGIGSGLIDHFCKKVKEKGCEFITLTTLVDNEYAIKYYQKMGFEKPIKIEKVGIPRILFKKKI